MKRRAVVDWVAVVALPVAAFAALMFLGDRVDPCLSPGPSCGTEPGVSPWLIVLPAIALWVIAAFDIVRTRRRR